MNVTLQYEPGAADLAREHFGREASDEELAAAVGALDGATLKSAQTVNDLIWLGGRQWWRDNGTARRMHFDLADDSSMMRILTDYLRGKGLLKE